MFEGMTLEEAIAHAKEVAVENRKKEAWNRDNPHIWNDGGRRYAECKKCADEHEQLAAWLEELERYRAIATGSPYKPKVNTHIVLKREDVLKYLEEPEQVALDNIMYKIMRGRTGDRKPRLNYYYVVNRDEPYAEAVYNVIIGGEAVKEKQRRKKEVERLKALEVEKTPKEVVNYSVAVLAEVAECARQEDAPIYEGDKEVDRWVRLSDVEEAINKHLN